MQPENQAPQQPPNQQPYSHTSAQQPLATTANAQHQRKSLAIAIIFGVVFLLVAICVTIWLLTKPEATISGINPATEDVKDVKNITWFGPPDLPASYALRDQNSDSIKTTLFVDEAGGCTITLNTIQLNDANGKAPKEATEKAVSRTENIGTTVTKNTTGENIIIKDHESGKEYQFETINLEQDVNAAGVDTKKQFTALAYKQFGIKVATIGYSCKEAVWQGRKGDMKTLAEKFTIKTER